MLTAKREPTKSREDSGVADVALSKEANARFRQAEFYAFCVAGFAAKSFLLIRLPYRPLYENTLYTVALLLFIYLYFRLRQGIVIPAFVLSCLAMAIGVDVLGNLLQLYGKSFGPLNDYDVFAHFVGSGLSLVPVMWLLRASLARMGYRLPLGLLTFLSVAVTFSYCAWYEVLELWDELFYGDNIRIWSPRDTPNDLQLDLAGIILFALISVAAYKLAERGERPLVIQDR